MELQELIYAPSGSPEEAFEEMAEVEAARAKVNQKVRVLQDRMHHAEVQLSSIRADYQVSRGELAMLDERLAFLQQEAGKSALRKSAKPDPSAVRTVDEFVDALRDLRDWAGNPTYEAMANRARGVVGRATMEPALRKGILPGLNAVRAVVEGCGGNEKDVEAFVAAWHRVAPERSPLKNPS